MGLHHALHVANLPDHHRDPFDRLLVAQPALEVLTLFWTDRGKPIASLVPLEEESMSSLLGRLSYHDESDLNDPADEPWEVDR